MIKVNWDKIKPFESKPFAIFAITALLVLLIGALVIGAINPLMYMPLKLLTAVFVFITVAFKVRIESRMLQIYMLLGVLDVSLFCAAIMPFPIGLTFFFFAVSLLSVILCVATTVWASVFVKKDTAYNFPEADRSSVFANKNVMFFAPHEDDEINIYGGVIEQYVKYGSDVRIVFYTNGDYHNLGQLRIKETLCVAKKYNIPEKNIIFLGYSDSLTDKNSLHIYNSKDGEEVFYSRYVVSQTYGIKPKPPYKEHKFTRNNILSDIKSVILEYKPDTLFCCDYDEHMDHRALSMFFEEALYSILKENTLYFPEVYKGFAYSTAWHGNEDYYSLNALSTRLIEPSAYMKETGYYDWKDRVRFPVAKESLSRVMQNTSSYSAMSEYSSQTATDHANGILNSDKVFWKRRTDCVLYNAQITATSGNPQKLIEFPLACCNDIAKDNGMPADGLWTADKNDEQRIIAVKLPAPRKICCIAIYENPSENSHILNAQINLGAVRYETGELKNNGAATVFEFPPVTTDIIGIKIKSFTGDCSLLKIEAFDRYENNACEFVKLQNADGDFCYDYIVKKSGKEEFTVYTYPNQESFEFTAESSEEGVLCSVENGVLKVNCPEGEKSVITIKSTQNPAVCDSITVRNPDERERYIISLKQKIESDLPSFPMLWDYYRGLLRRLKTYKTK